MRKIDEMKMNEKRVLCCGILEVFCEKGVFKNFTKFTGKHLCQSLLLIKLLAEAFKCIKKETPHRCFPVSFWK